MLMSPPGAHRPDRSRAHRPVPRGGDHLLVRLRDASHLLAAVPYLLGGDPGEPSLVVLGIRARRVVTTHGIHLPTPENLPAHGLAGAWAIFTRALAGNTANAVSIIAYTDRT